MYSLRAYKIYLSVLFGCLICSVSIAEYKELEILKQSSCLVLRGYAEHFAAMDPKFEGALEFGQSLQAIENEIKINVMKLTCQNENYWRAILEMTPKDSSILFAHAHLHAARGETSYADVYFLLGSLTSGKSHRAELNKYKSLRNELNIKGAQEIDKGIKLHDQGEYEKAVEAYERVIAEHPNSALAYYEKGLTYMMMSKADPNLKQTAMQMYAECRRLDPFHWRAYQGSDRGMIQKLQIYLKQVDPFLSGKKRTKEGFIAFAEGCEAMELYPFAAHAQWKLALIDSENIQEHIKKFLDLIEKCGCENVVFFRKQFKFNESK